MSDQQSQKRGLASEGQKEQRARDGYAPIPPSNPVGGAFGDKEKGSTTDEEHALTHEEKRRQKEARQG
jgi:hypothetical protein